MKIRGDLHPSQLIQFKYFEKFIERSPQARGRWYPVQYCSEHEEQVRGEGEWVAGC